MAGDSSAHHDLNGSVSLLGEGQARIRDVLFFKILGVLKAFAVGVKTIF